MTAAAMVATVAASEAAATSAVRAQVEPTNRFGAAVRIAMRNEHSRKWRANGPEPRAVQSFVVIESPSGRVASRICRFGVEMRAAAMLCLAFYNVIAGAHTEAVERRIVELGNNTQLEIDEALLQDGLVSANPLDGQRARIGIGATVAMFFFLAGITVVPFATFEPPQKFYSQSESIDLACVTSPSTSDTHPPCREPRFRM